MSKVHCLLAEALLHWLLVLATSMFVEFSFNMSWISPTSGRDSEETSDVHSVHVVGCLRQSFLAFLMEYCNYCFSSIQYINITLTVSLWFVCTDHQSLMIIIIIGSLNIAHPICP